MKPEGTLARLAKAWGVTPTATAPDEATAALQAQFDEFRAAAEADLNEVKTALESAVQAIRDVEAERDSLAEKLAALEAAQAAAAEKAVADKMQARKDRIVALLGTERADAVFTATSNLSDEGFEAVVGAMSAAQADESKSPLFTEQGVGAEASPAAAADQPSKEMQILRAKYAK